MEIEILYGDLARVRVPISELGYLKDNGVQAVFLWRSKVLLEHAFMYSRYGVRQQVRPGNQLWVGLYCWIHGGGFQMWGADGASDSGGSRPISDLTHIFMAETVPCERWPKVQEVIRSIAGDAVPWNMPGYSSTTTN